MKSNLGAARGKQAEKPTWWVWEPKNKRKNPKPEAEQESEEQYDPERTKKQDNRATMERNMSAESRKELYIVGLGPGARQKMTQEAIDVVEACEVIAGYKVYIELLKPYYPDKEYLVNGMRQEVERCRLALETAANGKKTALVCSGDAGVYGMAGITLELAAEFPRGMYM